MNRSLLALVALVALAATPSPRPSPSRPPSPRPSPTRLPSPAPNGGAQFDLGVWTVHASEVDANFKTGAFTTKHKVLMTRVGGDVTADRADGNFNKHLVNLYGHVVMHDRKGDYGGLAPLKPGQKVEPSTLTADKAQIDGQAAVYTAIGNVHFVQGDTDVTADRGTLNDRTHELNMKGHVHIRQGNRTIVADSTRYNTVTGLAHAQGNVIIQFPGEFKRGLATPRPINIPKNPLTEPASGATAKP